MNQEKLKTDELLEQIAEYVCAGPSPTEEALMTARLCLFDALGCAIASLKYPSCTKLLGPIVPGTVVPNGCLIPGTSYVLDPIRGAFNLGTMIRWLDFNDTWLALEWGHPSDTIGGLLPLMDYLSKKLHSENKPVFTVKDLLLAMIRAYEIQGVLSLNHSFNRIGFDHVILVKIATSAVATWLLGGSYQQVIDTLSNAWIDFGPLRTYRHDSNTGSRKSWAAGDAASRGVQLAMMTLQGEMGYATPLSANRWGLSDVFKQAFPLTLARPLDCYVMENILFKVDFPSEFHAQTSIEAAIQLFPYVSKRLSAISSIQIKTHESAIRIIDKKGVLTNPADRDHCLQYMVAVALIYGDLSSEHYEDLIASDPRIEELRSLMHVEEDKNYSVDYLDPEKRSVASSICVHFNDGSSTDKVQIEYPLGHRFRRSEARIRLLKKLTNNLSSFFPLGRIKLIEALFSDPERLDQIVIPSFVELFIRDKR